MADEEKIASCIRGYHIYKTDDHTILKAMFPYDGSLLRSRSIVTFFNLSQLFPSHLTSLAIAAVGILRERIK